MSFKLLPAPVKTEKEMYSKYYFKLVQIEFHNFNSLESARSYYAQKYNQICQPVIEWE